MDACQNTSQRPQVRYTLKVEKSIEKEKATERSCLSICHNRQIDFYRLRFHLAFRAAAN